ncbi:TPA: ead/Ea22-like family protein [Klebsiella pneumoniae]
MTDITALAQSLKAAADREMICRDGAETSEIWERTVTPENILALVEALEKAQQRIDELENDEVRQRLANAEHQLYMAELAKNNLRASRKAQFRKRKAAEQRIAELESRTVTVKLPQRLQPGADGWDDWYVHSDDEGEYLKFDDVLAMLTVAGIKVEAE